VFQIPGSNAPSDIRLRAFWSCPFVQSRQRRLGRVRLPKHPVRRRRPGIWEGSLKFPPLATWCLYWVNYGEGASAALCSIAPTFPIVLLSRATRGSRGAPDWMVSARRRNPVPGLEPSVPRSIFLGEVSLVLLIATARGNRGYDRI
jgi:hypothetical protein